MTIEYEAESTRKMDTNILILFEYLQFYIQQCSCNEMVIKEFKTFTLR